MNRLVHPNRIYQALSSFALAAFAIAALALALASLSNCRVSPAPGSCRTSQDCKDPAREGHDPAKLVCHPSLGTCVASVDGGVRDVGPDGPQIKKKKGAACGSTAQCESGLFCVDDLCCTAECSGVCEACNLAGSLGDCVKAAPGDDPRKKCVGEPGCAGTCDGQGACSFSLVAGKACGAPSCVSGELSSGSCSADGKCAVAKQTCGGYACEAGGGACKKTCASTAADCLAPFKCVGLACVNDLPDGDPCGTNHDACKNKHCVDGVCCNSDCTGACKSCALSGKKGTCSPIPDGQDPDFDCKGDLACGNGSCKTGACDYPKVNTECGSSCGSGVQTISLCSATHVCTAGPPTSCPFTLCDVVTKKCKTGCVTHADCVSGSLCDRSAAHLTGLGVCVDPAKIVPVSTTIAAAVAATSAAKPYVFVPAGIYPASVSISVPHAVKIVGASASTVTIQPPSTNVAGVVVNAGTNVTLQGLKLYLAAGGVDADGVRCLGASASNRSTLVVVECVIADNKDLGVEGTNCDVTLHRNTIGPSNSGGGVKLGDGKLEVVNNVIVLNGTAGSAVGGAKLDPGTASASFVNNTVKGNNGGPGATGGVMCAISTIAVVNSIVWGNTADGSPSQYSGCTFNYSDIQGGVTGGTGNLNLDPQLDASYKPATTSPVLEKGTDTTASVIDLVGTARKLGTAVDMGAYEVK